MSQFTGHDILARVIYNQSENNMDSKGFDPKDLEDICSRPRNKFKMKRSDFKEMGRNILLGSVDVAVGCLGAAVLIAGTTNMSRGNKSNNQMLDGYRDGHSGYGDYFGDIKKDD